LVLVLSLYISKKNEISNMFQYALPSFAAYNPGKFVNLKGISNVIKS
jgi:hypothetical protein